MAAAQKLDLYKTFAADYAAPPIPTLITPHPAQYLAITGQGEPGGEVFTIRLGLLYNLAFTVKMAKKFAGTDYAVSKLEGLWWGRKKAGITFLDEARSQWRWQLLIRTPDFIRAMDRSAALEQLRGRGKDPAVGDVTLIRLDEGPSIQLLHVGPYAAERASLERMHTFAASKGLRPHGKHHEIYLSDPRRVPASRLKTILRLPVRAA
ncbi:MAG TPA: GyrI-like domain-containing protein [Gemmatimonadales bacterium]|nr:GyrI-like domain-containing protein [Gemmatimonadales bacterium]